MTQTKQLKAKIWASDASRFKYALDMISYEIPQLNYTKIKELADNLATTLHMVRARPISEDDAKEIKDKIYPTIKQLKLLMHPLVYGKLSKDAQIDLLTRYTRSIGRAVDEFETVKQSTVMTTVDIQRLFDMLSKRLHDSVERKQHCDTISDFTLNFYDRMCEKHKERPEVKKALFSLYTRAINELRQLAVEPKQAKQDQHLRKARDCFSKLETIEMIDKAEFDQALGDDIVRGFLKETGDARRGITPGKPDPESSAIKNERKKGYLRFLEDEENQEAELRTITMKFHDIPAPTVQADLTSLLKKDKFIKKTRRGCYALTSKGKRELQSEDD